MPSSPTKVKSSLLFSAHTNLPFPSLFFISAQYATQERRYHSDAITNSYREFVTPGHTLLHEVTHLDKVGALLENDPDNVGGHGTFVYINLDAKDPSVDNPGTDVSWQARQLQLLFVNNPDRTDTKDNVDQRVTPSRNAESFAGCGTEAFFMKFCDVPYIAPHTGVGPDDESEDPEDPPEWTPPK